MIPNTLLRKGFHREECNRASVAAVTEDTEGCAGSQCGMVRNRAYSFCGYHGMRVLGAIVRCPFR